MLRGRQVHPMAAGSCVAAGTLRASLRSGARLALGLCILIIPALPSVAQEATITARGQSLPRFVSLKAERVNVRRGPSSEHQISWVFTKKGLPVEIVAEFEQWRRIRDSEGAEGWVFHSMLTGKRTAMVAPWKKNRSIPLHAAAEHNAATVALARPGVIADINSCNGSWCELTAGGYKGFVEQLMLWGVYPGEQIGN